MLEFNKRSFRFNVPLVSVSINLVSNKYIPTTDPQLLNTDYYFTGDYTYELVPVICNDPWYQIP